MKTKYYIIKHVYLNGSSIAMSYDDTYDTWNGPLLLTLADTGFVGKDLKKNFYIIKEL